MIQVRGNAGNELHASTQKRRETGIEGGLN